MSAGDSHTKCNNGTSNETHLDVVGRRRPLAVVHHRRELEDILNSLHSERALLSKARLVGGASDAAVRPVRHRATAASAARRRVFRVIKFKC